jgi:hypothetical protein
VGIGADTNALLAVAVAAGVVAAASRPLTLTIDRPVAAGKAPAPFVALGGGIATGLEAAAAATNGFGVPNTGAVVAVTPAAEGALVAVVPRVIALQHTNRDMFG